MPTAVITGANRGLGLELTRQYLNEGWNIYTISRSHSDALDNLAKNRALTCLQANLTNDERLREAVAKIDSESVDLLINNAGMMGNGSFAETGLGYQSFGNFDRDEWLRIFDINVCTPMALSELLVDKLATAQRGCVVTLSSMLGSNAMNTIGNIYPYRASKAAVNSIMKSMGINLHERGVIAVAIQPGWVRTDMGGPHADIEAPESVQGMRATIARLTLEDSGKLFAYDGREMPY